MGKTQLAIEYVHRHREQYRYAWWLRSQDSATLAGDLAALARALALPHLEFANQAEAARAALAWLSRNDAWLLVFDNAPDVATVLPHLPDAGSGHVLVTSRNPDWHRRLYALPVKPLARDSSIEFVLKRTGQTDTEAAGGLARKLGDLPLALEQASAYMEATRTPLPNYLSLYDSRRRELWAGEAAPADYPDTVATTWSLSMDRLAWELPVAIDLLHLLAFLAPDDVPRGLLVQGREHLPEPLASAVADPIALNSAVAALRRYSLVEMRDGAFSVHRLVQTVVRDRLNEGSEHAWAGPAVRMVDAAFPHHAADSGTWPTCGRILPHALAAIDHADTLEVDAYSTAHLMNQVGVYLNSRGVYADARPLLERALEIRQETFGLEDPQTGTSLNNLASLLENTGDNTTAIQLYTRALEIQEKVGEPDDPATATCLNNLGNALHATGKLKEARRLLKRALRIRVKALGPEHPKTAKSYNNLAAVLRAAGQHQAALRLLEQALAIQEKALGEHYDTAMTLANMGALLLETGNPGAACPLAWREMEITAKILGPKHPATATSLNNLAMSLADAGDNYTARQLLERALAIREEVSWEHHSTALILSNLAALLLKTGDLKAAEPLAERALGLFERTLGKDHPTTIRARNIGLVITREKANAGVQGRDRS